MRVAGVSALAAALPDQLGSFPFWREYTIVAGYWLLAWLALSLRARARDGRGAAAFHPQSVLLLLGLSVLGLTIGLMVGNSRNPAVAAAISAVLAVYGGFTGYLFTRNREQGLVASLGLIGFTICVEYGTQTGAAFRVIGEDQAKQLEVWYQKDMANYQAQLDVWKASMATQHADAASPAPGPAAAASH